MFTVAVSCGAVKVGPMPGGRVLVVVLSVLLLIGVVLYFRCSSCLVGCRCLDLLFGCFFVAEPFGFAYFDC